MKWERTRWLTTQIFNMLSGKDKKPSELYKFEDEIPKVDPEKAKKEMLKLASKQMKKFPKLFKKGKDGLPIIYGEGREK